MRFDAPWSAGVKASTAVALLLLAGVAVIGLRVLPPRAPGMARAVCLVVPVLVLVGTLPFAVRGYSVDSGEIVVRRLGVNVRVPLSRVVSAEADPQATARSIRVFGSGGLFGFFGKFSNDRLGSYTAYGTDPAHAVVLRLADGGVFVVTPGDPERFAAEVNARRG